MGKPEDLEGGIPLTAPNLMYAILRHKGGCQWTLLGAYLNKHQALEAYKLHEELGAGPDLHIVRYTFIFDDWFIPAETADV